MIFWVRTNLILAFHGQSDFRNGQSLTVPVIAAPCPGWLVICSLCVLPLWRLTSRGYRFDWKTKKMKALVQESTYVFLSRFQVIPLHLVTDFLGLLNSFFVSWMALGIGSWSVESCWLQCVNWKSWEGSSNSDQESFLHKTLAIHLLIPDTELPRFPHEVWAGVQPMMTEVDTSQRVCKLKELLEEGSPLEQRWGKGVIGIGLPKLFLIWCSTFPMPGAAVRFPSQQIFKKRWDDPPGRFSIANGPLVTWSLRLYESCSTS